MLPRSTSLRARVGVLTGLGSSYCSIEGVFLGPDYAMAVGITWSGFGVFLYAIGSGFITVGIFCLTGAVTTDPIVCVPGGEKWAQCALSGYASSDQVQLGEARKHGAQTGFVIVWMGSVMVLLGTCGAAEEMNWHGNITGRILVSIGLMVVGMTLVTLVPAPQQTVDHADPTNISLGTAWLQGGIHQLGADVALVIGPAISSLEVFCCGVSTHFCHKDGVLVLFNVSALILLATCVSGFLWGQSACATEWRVAQTAGFSCMCELFAGGLACAIALINAQDGLSIFCGVALLLGGLRGGIDMKNAIDRAGADNGDHCSGPLVTNQEKYDDRTPVDLAVSKSSVELFPILGLLTAICVMFVMRRRMFALATRELRAAADVEDPELQDEGQQLVQSQEGH